MKFCISCDTNYQLSYFYKKKDNKDGHSTLCKQCSTLQYGKKREVTRKTNTAKLAERSRVYREDNKEKTLAYAKGQYLKNRTRILAKRKEDYIPSPNGIPSDNNIFYVWEAIGEKWNDKPIFKIGITSKRLGNKRINEVARKHNFTPKIIVKRLCSNAREFERKILNSLFDIPKLLGNGATEFRACTYKEIDKCLLSN